jgi:hypothetical protein
MATRRVRLGLMVTGNYLPPSRSSVQCELYEKVNLFK